MEPIVLKRNFATAPFLVGTLLLLCALTFYLFAVLRVDYSKTALLDLDPGPDAREYFAQAESLLKEGLPQIQVGFDKLPSRYPPGYPVLMLPALKFLPTSAAILAPFRTNQVIGLLLLLFAFAAYALLARPLAGGFAVLLLATLPAFFIFSRSCMSEISASGLIVLAFLCVYLGLKSNHRWKIYLAAVFLGLSLNIRTQYLLFGPLLLAMALFPSRGSRLRWFLHCVGALLVFALAASPVLVLNAVQLHSPFKTGYGFWMPYNRVFFSIHNVPKQVAMLGAECTLRRTNFSVANIFGSGTYFVPAYLVLFCAGFTLMRGTRFVICALVSALTYFAVTLTYFSADNRSYFPLFILAAGVAVLPIEWAASKAIAGQQRFTVLCIFVLFILAVVGYPSQAGYPPKDRRSQAWEAVHFVSQSGRSDWYAAQKAFVHSVRPQTAVVLSDIDPVYLNALFSPPFIAAPVDKIHPHRYSQLWSYGEKDAVSLIRHALTRHASVYALFVPGKDMASQFARLPAMEGYRWDTVANASADAVILKLAPQLTE